MPAIDLSTEACIVSIVDPHEALRRIAFLLETSGAETYKVRAFRHAARAIAPLSAEEIAALVTSRQLKDLPGIGKTTAEIIAQAVAGQTPTYLEALEHDQPSLPAPSERAQQIRALLRGDCHSHSEWSDGASPIEEMAQAAKALGHDYLVLTDHSPRLTVAHGLDRERLLAQLEVISEVNAGLAPFRLLTGIEVDILEDGGLDQEEELLARLDVVVASVHSKLRMDSQTMTKRMVAAIESPHTDILGHCTGRLISGKGRAPSSFDPAEVFEACARTGTAVEINSRPERRDPPPELLDVAVRSGCLFSIDTDAHAPEQLEWLENGCAQAAEAAVRDEVIVNAWSHVALLAWAGAHGNQSS